MPVLCHSPDGGSFVPSFVPRQRTHWFHRHRGGHARPGRRTVRGTVLPKPSPRAYGGSSAPVRKKRAVAVLLQSAGHLVHRSRRARHESSPACRWPSERKRGRMDTMSATGEVGFEGDRGELSIIGREEIGDGMREMIKLSDYLYERKEVPVSTLQRQFRVFLENLRK